MTEQYKPTTNFLSPEARVDACIRLCIPESGNSKLDHLIRKAANEKIKLAVIKAIVEKEPDHTGRYTKQRVDEIMKGLVACDKEKV